MIFFVIVLHVSMTYMLDVPSWWYVVSEEKNSVFLTIVNILDVFMMPVLFFISGYFTPASFLKKGFPAFLKDKIKHIALPWLLGIAVLIPLFPLCTGEPIEYVIDSVKANPAYLFNSQAHLWYLGVLFIFLIAYAIFAYIDPPKHKRTPESNKKNILLLVSLIIISAACSHFSDHYITSYDNWIYPAYIFTLKPAKIVTYICIFILGVYAWQKNWFTKDGWMPSLTVWRILAICSVAFIIILKLVIIPDYDLPRLESLIPVLDSFCAFTTLIYALLIGVKLQNSNLSEFMTKISTYSYGIYWIHMPIAIFYLYLINDLNIPILIKWISGIVVTSIISFLFSKYILKKVAFLKDIF